MDALAGRAIEGLGTTESEWLGWPGLDRIPPVTAAGLVPAGRRAVVVAPHPDDEVLTVGGLGVQLAWLRREVLRVAVTDGEASHAGSTQWPPGRLARARPLESRRAWRRLGLEHTEPVRLGLPDGGLARLEGPLADRLATLLRTDDVVFTTWRLDGHPDHEATGRACASAAARTGATLVEVPVWAWHWARPGDVRLPWRRARRLSLDAQAVRRKRHAVAAFTSQLMPDASTGAGPILRATTVERTARPFEVLFL